MHLTVNQSRGFGIGSSPRGGAVKKPSVVTDGFAVMGYCVYILYSVKLDKYYIGQTQNLELRLLFHNDPIESRKFTARGIPWVLQVAIPCTSKEQSLKLEKFIKRMKSRKFIKAMINDVDLQNDIKNKCLT